MTLYKLIAMVLLVVSSVGATPQSTYKGKPINIDTILGLVPNIPAELAIKTQQAFKQNPTLATILSGESYSRIIPGTSHAPFSINFDNITKADEQLFLKPRREDLSRIGIQARGYGELLKNLTINLDENWLIKASGFLNRRANILHEMTLNNRDPELPQAKLHEFITSHGGRTYQTISRMVYWLRAKEAQEKLALDRICLPEKYLVHIPGRPTFLDDTNYVVAAQKIQNAKPITQTDLLEDEAVVTQLAQVILYASLWDVHEENILAKDGKACIIDVEQPNSFKPSEFGRGGIMNSAIEGLKNLIQKYGDKVKKDVSKLKDLVDAQQKSLE